MLLGTLKCCEGITLGSPDFPQYEKSLEAVEDLVRNVKGLVAFCEGHLSRLAGVPRQEESRVMRSRLSFVRSILDSADTAAGVVRSAKAGACLLDSERRAVERRAAAQESEVLGREAIPGGSGILSGERALAAAATAPPAPLHVPSTPSVAGYGSPAARAQRRANAAKELGAEAQRRAAAAAAAAASLSDESSPSSGAAPGADFLGQESPRRESETRRGDPAPAADATSPPAPTTPLPTEGGRDGAQAQPGAHVGEGVRGCADATAAATASWTDNSSPAAAAAAAGLASPSDVPTSVDNRVPVEAKGWTAQVGFAFAM